MNRKELLAEVTEFINTQINVDDPEGEVDLGAAAAEIEEFVQELDANVDDDEDEDEGEGGGEPAAGESTK